MNELHDRDVDDLRRTLLALLPAALCASCTKSGPDPAATAATRSDSEARDPVVMQPSAFRVVLENDQVRVLEFNSRPGMGVCGSGMHSHPPHLTVALSPATVKVTLPDGKYFVPPENKIGDVWWSPAETHETENISGKDVRALIVELKPARGAA